MMFPLCTRVTDFRPLSIAYRIAFRTRRFEPVSLMGLTPIPLSARTRVWNSLSRISIIRRASAVPFSHSIRRRPPKALATAASIALRAARTTSGPMPSPSISGIIGSSGTRSPLSAIKILWPVSGGRRTRRSNGMQDASGSLVEGHVDEVFRAHVPVERPQEAIVLPVLDDLGRPSGDPGDREDRCEKVGRDPEAVEDQSGVEVHVREDLFGGELSHDRVLDFGRDPVIRVVPAHLGEAAGEVLEDERPRVVRLVDAAAEPADLLLFRRVFRTNSSASFGWPIRSIVLRDASIAPPWSGPLSVESAAVIVL